jgi:hypothetical protein
MGRRTEGLDKGLDEGLEVRVMGILYSFEGFEMNKARQKWVNENPWLGDNYNLDAITIRLKERAWLKEGMHEMPDWALREAHGHLRPEQKEALNVFRKRFLETFGQSYEAVFPGTPTDIGRTIRKELGSLEMAFEDLSGYNPVSHGGTYDITKDGKLLACQQAEVGGVGCLSEDVLLGKVAPKDCPHSGFREGFDYPEGHPFHRQGELMKPQQINGADYAPGGKLYQTPALSAEATPSVPEPAKPAIGEPVTEIKVRAKPGAAEVPAEKWSSQHIETIRDRLRVDKVEVVKRPIEVLNAEGKWTDAEPLLVLKATKTVNGHTHVLELSGQEVIHAAKAPSKLFEKQVLKESPVLREFFQGHGLEARNAPPVRGYQYSGGRDAPPAKPLVAPGKAGANAAKVEEGIGKWVQRVFHEHPGKSWGAVAGIVAAGGAVAYLARRKKEEQKQETAAAR